MNENPDRGLEHDAPGKKPEMKEKPLNETQRSA
jgi:hypothetical protein